MENIKELDAKYVKCLDEKSKYNTKINSVNAEMSKKDGWKALQIASEGVDSQTWNNDSKTFTNLDYVERLSFLYTVYKNDVTKLNDLLNAQISEYSLNRMGEINSVKNSIKEVYDNIINLKKELEDKTGKQNINDISNLCDIYISCVREKIAQLDLERECIKSEARMIFANNSTLNLSLNDSLFVSENELPSSIVVAKEFIREDSSQLLKDINCSKVSESISIDVRKKGNILLEVGIDQFENPEIDSFVTAYIFKYVSSFPAGAVHVHIFDTNPNFIFKRMSNIFQNENAGEATKQIVQIHTALTDLLKFKDSVCEDIFSKTSVDKPDLFSIYEQDRTDSFTLIVIRDGLVDKSGYMAQEILNALSSLIRENEIGFKCGIRFLIVDDSDDLSNQISSGIKSEIDEIKKNCEVCFHYDESGFNRNGHSIQTLSISDNLEAYVQERASRIVNAVSKAEKQCISLSDIADEMVECLSDSILYIPIGKMGAECVEIPFSCKDESGSAAGQCIGYMAIGQSGSGKSSFFHSLVMNGCMKYSPLDLQFWLLDFKFGGASSKYRNSNLPHVKVIAENNKVDDALCLFQMIQEEMDRRNKAFNDAFVDNIVDYNIVARQSDSMEVFPRVIIAIDEVQEIFRDDSAAELQKMLSSISVRMRSAGMHFVMIAQNLCEGKSYMLKEAFLPSATGRVCFRVATNIARDSGFGEEYSQRDSEITSLRTGEAYISYGENTLKRIKVAYVSPDDMRKTYFGVICSRYATGFPNKTLVIGSKKRLCIYSELTNDRETFFEKISKIRKSGSVFKAILGEDSYRMDLLSTNFSQNENSTLLILGEDKAISSSLCSSVATSLINQGAKVSLFNGDKTKLQDGLDTSEHPFMALCKYYSGVDGNVISYKLSQIDEVIGRIYKLYLERQKQTQDADSEDLNFEEEFLIINDLLAIEKFVNDVSIDCEDSVSSEDYISKESDSLFSNPFDSFSKGNSSESIQKIFSILMKSGFRYGIHIIVSVKSETNEWRYVRDISDVNNVIIFNSTSFAEYFDKSFYIKEMLGNISNGTECETLAVWNFKRRLSKFRPVIYNLFENREKEIFTNLIEKEGV